MLAAGMTLGTHKVAGRIGADGMGNAFRARDKRLERDVAVEVLPNTRTREDTTHSTRNPGRLR